MQDSSQKLAVAPLEKCPAWGGGGESPPIHTYTTEGKAETVLHY